MCQMWSSNFFIPSNIRSKFHSQILLLNHQVCGQWRSFRDSNVNKLPMRVVIFLEPGAKTLPHQRKASVTERFKRPFKKRHASILHQTTNRTNKHLGQAVSYFIIYDWLTVRLRLDFHPGDFYCMYITFYQCNKNCQDKSRAFISG